MRCLQNIHAKNGLTFFNKLMPLVKVAKRKFHVDFMDGSNV